MKIIGNPMNIQKNLMNIPWHIHYIEDHNGTARFFEKRGA
jgi:hypothetical protein